MQSRGLPLNHPDREKMEELCCLSALGELPPQDRIEFNEHLQSCSECQTQTREFEKLILFDLSFASVLRAENVIPEIMGLTSEQKLLAGIQERAKTLTMRRAAQPYAEDEFAGTSTIQAWKHTQRMTRLAIPWLGWAAAAMLIIVLGTKINQPRGAETFVSVQPQLPAGSAELEVLRQRTLKLEAEKEKALSSLSEAEISARNSEAAYAQLSAQNRDLDARSSALSAKSDQLSASLGQRTAELELARRQLYEETASRQTAQEQLATANARLEIQKIEAARLEALASNSQTRLPMAGTDFSSNDAKEILGARDLHIVDVYDVDKGGKSSRVYGRVYQVNRSLLIFYAFDLPQTQKNHKAVAFQAWGFRQPHSTTAENLGLFYMDNATLNRWALRVSDPLLLSRIDTLFVTLEPPGGSSSPKGKKLLMASLAGPANHP